MPTTLTNTMLRKIRAKQRGWVFTAQNFHGLGSRAAIHQALSRLQKKGQIRRLASGIYEFPKIHSKIGVLSPNPEAVAKAMAERTQSRIMMSEATAANKLGLSNQVPMRNVYLTEGPSRKVRIGKQEISLKHVAPSKLTVAGTEAEVVVQAVRSFGKEGAGKIPVKMLANKLPYHVKKSVKRRANSAPAWSQPILEQISR